MSAWDLEAPLASGLWPLASGRAALPALPAWRQLTPPGGFSQAAWNKIPLLYVLMHPESPVRREARRGSSQRCVERRRLPRR